MGLGIAIAGSISIAVLFMVITVIPGTSDKLVDLIDARSQINNAQKKIDKTDFQIGTIVGNVGSDLISFIISNTGTEKLWNYDKFNILVEYDADVLGVKTRTTEFLTFNKFATFFPSPPQIAVPNQDITVGLWTAIPLYQKIDEVSFSDIDFVTDTTRPQTTDIKQNATATGEDFNQWLQPEFAFISDDNRASALINGFQQDYYNFNLSFPSNAEIEGVEVRIEGSRIAAGTSGVNVELSWDGGPSYTTSGYTGSWSTGADQIRILGGPTDKWGRVSWSIDDFSNSNFRLKISKTGDVGTTTRVDHIQVIVYYGPWKTTTAEVKLSTISDPFTSIGHVLKFRENGKLNRDATVTLLQGSTPIHSQNFSSNNLFTTQEFTLTSTEADSITDYSDLRVRWYFTNTGVAGGNTDVSWIQFQVPGGLATGSSKEWGINGSNEDAYDPRIINPGESFEFGGKLSYPVYPNGLVKVVVSLDNGKSASSSVTVS